MSKVLKHCRLGTAVLDASNQNQRKMPLQNSLKRIISNPPMLNKNHFQTFFPTESLSLTFLEMQIEI